MKTRLVLALILAIYAVFTWWLADGLHEAGKSISKSWTEMAKPSAYPAAIVRFDGVKKGLIVPAWSWTDQGRVWNLVSKNSPIDKNFEPKLVGLTVNKGNWLYSDKVQPEVNEALSGLFGEAAKSNFPLIVTSAYRSAESQIDLIESSVNNYGAEWTQKYVASPGESEHQLGLAVDLSSYTEACVQSLANCNLGPNTASWLAENSHNHGFILRYPKDKTHITKVSYEPWHFRYVGVELASIIKQSGLTLDEIIPKMKEVKNDTN